MSYARFGWNGSDVYVFGGVLSEDDFGSPRSHMIECCSCMLVKDESSSSQRPRVRKFRPGEYPSWLLDMHASNPKGIGGVSYLDMEWDMAMAQIFTTKEGIISHLRAHISAGHCVPDDVIPAIENDDWLLE